MAEIQWIGGPTVLVRIGGMTLLTDPMLAEGPEAFFMNGHPSTGADRAPIARNAPLPEVDLSQVDLVLVSHLHSDHFDRVAVERLDKDIPVVAPANQVQRILDWGFTNVSGLTWGQEYTGPDHPILIRAVPAQHAADPAVNRSLGIVNGYAITCTAGETTTIYWTGDTVWFDGLLQVRDELPAVDLLLPHIGAVGEGGPWGRMTLDAAEATKLFALFDPRWMLPIHHHTFSHYVEPVAALQERSRQAGFQDRLVVLREGEKLAW